MANLTVNAFRAYLASSLQSAGSETTIYIDRITTLTGETITTADFSTFGRGTITLDPLSATAIEFASFTGVDSVNLALTGAIRGLSAKSNTSSTTRMPYHAVSTPVIISFGVHNLEDLKAYVDGILAGTIGNASATVTGITKLSTAPVSPTIPIAVGDNDSRVPTVPQTTLLSVLNTGITGFIWPYAGKAIPSGWLECDGSAVSRSTYATLLSVIAPSGTVTVTIASPGVFTKTSHGFIAGDRVHFTTTGGLPSGISAGTEYFVISTSLTTNTFQVALSPEGTAVITSGSQSGVHTVYNHFWGMGDGTTTINVPDLRAKTLIGVGGSTQTLKFESGAVNTGTDIVTIPNYIFPAQGQKVQLTTTGTLPTGLSLSTDYYIVRVSTTTIKFSTTQAGANAGSLIVDITGVGSGVHTLTYTNVTDSRIGSIGGEETHTEAATEQAAHSHLITGANRIVAGGGTVASPSGTQGGSQILNSTDGVTSSDGPHNNMQPFARTKFLIKT